MATIAELVVALGVDSSGLDAGLGEVPGKLDRASQQMVASGTMLTKGVTLPILAAGAGLFALAGKQEDAEMRLQSSYASMAAAGWTTIDELKKQASAFQEASTFGDEDIINFQSKLLTFGNVTGDVFTKTTQLGLDMSAKLGTDLQSTAMQLGRAMNDPITGLTALTRSGVSFTSEQKDMVKSMVEAGDMAGAQALILSELEKQFGGTAAAMASTGTGQAKQAMNALGDAGETIGSFVIPVVSKLAGWLKTLSTWFQNLSPQAKEWVVRLAAVAAAVGPVLIIGGKMVKGFKAISGAFRAMSALVAANPWVLLIAATIALVILIVKNWDKIKAAVAAVWQWIKDAAATVWDVVSGVFQHIADFLVGLFENWTLPGLIMKHWDTIKTAATAVKDWVVEKFQAVLDFFKALPGKLGDFFIGLADTITAPFRAAFNAIANLWNNTVGSLSFKVPSWVPVIGGKGWDVPDIPTFHEGGVFRAGRPGGEGLALLRDGERVTPAGMPAMNVTVRVDARGNPNADAIAEATVRAFDRRLRIFKAAAQRGI